jgi:hypothetical protein
LAFVKPRTRAPSGEPFVVRSPPPAASVPIDLLARCHEKEDALQNLHPIWEAVLSRYRQTE